VFSLSAHIYYCQLDYGSDDDWIDPVVCWKRGLCQGYNRCQLDDEKDDDDDHEVKRYRRKEKVETLRKLLTSFGE
jgi:hypothetical protein